MSKGLENCNFVISFELPGVIRDKGFGSDFGSFSQRFKDRVSPALHADLESLSLLDMIIIDGVDDHFSFILFGSDQKKAADAALMVLNLCKIVHNYKGPIDIKVKQFALAEKSVMFRLLVKAFIAMAFVIVLSVFGFMGYVLYKGPQVDYSTGLYGAFEQIVFGKKPTPETLPENPQKEK